MTTSFVTPWYFTGYALVGYILLFVLVIYVIYRLQKKAITSLRSEVLQTSKIELNDSSISDKNLTVKEKENSTIEIEELKSQLKSKTIELASKAKESEEKSELIAKIQEKIDLIEGNPDSTKRQISEIKKLLDSNENLVDNTFEIQMNELHQDFFNRLKLKFPDLTTNDLRLSAYIKNGYNSKEIAEQLNIKPSSVYISRSRLRKKLNLHPDEDLYSYLQKI